MTAAARRDDRGPTRMTDDVNTSIALRDVPFSPHPQSSLLLSDVVSGDVSGLAWTGPLHFGRPQGVHRLMEIRRVL